MNNKKLPPGGRALIQSVLDTLSTTEQKEFIRIFNEEWEKTENLSLDELTQQLKVLNDKN